MEIGSHGTDYADYCFLGCAAMQSASILPVF
jgi:hypothetical protein